jgi:hypothetical protein
MLGDCIPLPGVSIPAVPTGGRETAKCATWAGADHDLTRWLQIVGGREIAKCATWAGADHDLIWWLRIASASAITAPMAPLVTITSGGAKWVAAAPAMMMAPPCPR